MEELIHKMETNTFIQWNLHNKPVFVVIFTYQFNINDPP